MNAHDLEMLNVMWEYSAVLQLIASCSGILVAGGLLFHDKIYGWRSLLAVTLLLFSVGSIDIGLKIVMGLEGNYLHHRMLFLVLAGCSLTWAIRSWRKDQAAQTPQVQILFALMIAHFMGLIAFVLPFWWHEEFDFARIAGEHLRIIPAEILAVISFFTIHVVFPRSWSWGKLFQQIITLIVAGFIFSMMLGSSGITAMSFDLVVMTTTLFVLFGQMVLSSELVSQLYESRKNDEKVIYKIRRIERGLRLISGGKSNLKDQRFSQDSVSNPDQTLV